MQALRHRFLAAPIVLLVALLCLAACGSAATSAPTAIGTESRSATSPPKAQDSAIRTGAGMAKTGDAMSKDAMAKTGDAMSKDAMAKTGDAMSKDGMAKTGDAMATPGSTLSLKFSGLEPLLGGFHYEGWAIINGSPVTTGKFNVDSEGDLVDLNSAPIAGGEFHTALDLASATAIVLTIEPADDIDTLPASSHYLGGNISRGSAELTVSPAAALGDDFSGASGTYILATPTNGDGNNENSGIWFLNLSTGSPTVGLTLPALPDGWEYEGWTVIDGTPVSTGRFVSAGQADFGALFSGAESSPPFPGEDFLQNSPDGLVFPTDLAGDVAVISIEPSPDDSDLPFTLKPLAGGIPDDATNHVNYMLENNASKFPSGTATVS